MKKLGPSESQRILLVFTGSTTIKTVVDVQASENANPNRMQGAGGGTQSFVLAPFVGAGTYEVARGAEGVIKQIEGINFRNIGAANATMWVRRWDGVRGSDVIGCILLPGETFEFDGARWRHYDTNAVERATGSTGVGVGESPAVDPGVGAPAPSPDTTAPVLSSPTGSATSSSAANGSVITNEAGGTLRWLVNGSPTASQASVLASPNSQGVSAVGVQGVSITGLSASTLYYFHYVQTDAAGNVSGVADSGSFTTPSTGGQVVNTALNLAGITYFEDYHPFINLVKHSGRQWELTGGASAAAFLDSNDEIVGMPNGGTEIGKVLMVNYGDYRNGAQKIRGGTYKITWSGACALSVSGTGVSSQVIASGVTTVTIANTCDLLFILCNNSSGSAASATNIKLFHTANETAMNAGDIFDSDWKAWVNSFKPNLKYLRVMDWQQTNFSAIVNAADIPQESWCDWARGSEYGGGRRGIPPSVIGKLAKELGVNVWMCLPYQATQACMNAYMQAVYNADPTGTWKIYIEYSNENWNFGFSHFNYLAGTKSAGLTIVDKNNVTSVADADKASNAAAHGAMQAWTAAEAAGFARNRIIRVFGGQTDYFDLFSGGFQYRDTTNTLFGGAQMKTLLDQTTGGSSDGKGRVPITVYYSELFLTSGAGGGLYQPIIDDRGAGPEAWFETVQKQSIDIVNTAVGNFRTGLTALGCSAPFITYECGNHSFYDCNSTGFSCYAATTGLLRFPTTADLGAFTNGDRIRVSGNLSLGSGLGQAQIAYLRKAGTNDLRLYVDATAYAADSGNTGAGAMVLDASTIAVTAMSQGSFYIIETVGTTNYVALGAASSTVGIVFQYNGTAASGTGTVKPIKSVNNQDRLNRYNQKLYDVCNGATGKTILQYAVDQVCRTKAVESWSHFTDLAAPTGDSKRFIRNFWIKPGVYTADNQVADYLQALS